MTAPRRLHIHQKISPMQNVYRVFADDAGQPGAQLGVVKQKRMALREQFTVYGDEAATQPVMTIKADRRLDLTSAMTVTDAATGQPLGQLRKQALSSLLRSTWEMDQPGMPTIVVRERSTAVALLRRFGGDLPIPWVFHFDGLVGDQKVLTHSRLWGIRDRYVMELLAPQIDWRVAIALAIVLDAMQGR